MKRLMSAVCIAGVLFTSCQPETPTFLRDPGAPVTEHIIDTVLVPQAYQYDLAGIDSLLRLKINLPAMKDSVTYPDILVKQFYQLASRTGGESYFLTQTDKITEQILAIIDEHLNDQTDLVFLIDNTGSMSDDIENVKKGVGTIIEHVKKKRDVNLAVATYGDRFSDGDRWYACIPFTTDYDSVKRYVNRIGLTNGGDYPESMYDAACMTMDTLTWRKASKKMILVLGDAPSLLPPQSDNGLKNVVAKAKEHGVLMNYYPVIISPLPEGSPLIEPGFKKRTLVSNVYPVPSAGDVNLLLNREGYYVWEVYDMTGLQIFKDEGMTDKIQLDLTAQANGVYIVRVMDGNSKLFEEKRVIVAH
jgi:hypothetical protein